MTETKQYQMKGKDKIITGYMLVGVIIQLYSLIFFGNWASLDLIMYLGVIVLVTAVILFLSGNILRKEGGMEEGKGFVTTKLVEAGIYRIIRHPIYLSWAYMFIGFALISQHPLSLFLGGTMALLCYYFMLEEEKLTVEKFGEDYVQFMKRVPRSNLLIGIWRLLRK